MGPEGPQSAPRDRKGPLEEKVSPEKGPREQGGQRRPRGKWALGGEEIKLWIQFINIVDLI